MKTMPSSNNKLQKLRKSAGFSTAKAFAQELDVPTSTYARYEQSPDSIPLKAAWRIADILDCSIDEVVGRSASGCAHENCAIRDRFDRLSFADRQYILDAFDFIDFKKRKREEEYLKRERERKVRRFNHYFQKFLKANAGRGFEENTFDNFEERILAFRDFVQAEIDRDKAECRENYLELFYRIKNKEPLDDVNPSLAILAKRKNFESLSTKELEREINDIEKRNDEHLQSIVKECMDCYTEMEGDIRF